MQKVKVWVLLILSIIAMFGTPMIAGYVMFAQDLSGQKGGGFFYFVMMIIMVVFIKRIGMSIKRMKSSNTKAVFKLFLTLIVLYFAYFFVNYVGVNFTELGKLIIYTIIGRGVSFIFEVLALRIDAEYIEEIGVM